MSIPVTLLAGYLGAGKTTLLNRLLSHRGDASGLGVLINDFGEVNVDAALVRDTAANGKLMSLTNGCVCCSVRDSLAEAFDMLAQHSVRRVLLEASGIASPAKLARQLSYPGFAPHGIFVVVDAVHHHARRADKYVGRLVAEQVEQADHLIISKLDLAPEFALSSSTPQSDARDPELLDRLLDADRSSITARATAQAEFSTLTLRPAQAMQIAEAYALLHALPDYVHRAKGFLPATDGMLLAQRVATDVTIEPCDEGAAPGLVLVFPAACRAELVSWLRRRMPQCVPAVP